MLMKTMKELRERAMALPKKTLAVAAADDPDVLAAVKHAIDLNMIDAILVGDAQGIAAHMRELGLDETAVRIVHEPNVKKSAAKAVRLVRTGEADILMKGLIGTADLLRCVLNREDGLRTEKSITAINVVDVPQMKRLLVVTDSGIHMYPDLQDKIKILDCVKLVTDVLGISVPKIAPICAIELVNPAMPPTLDAAQLAMMSRRGQIAGMVIDGPLALDVAVSERAAEHKGIKNSAVAGKADVLLMPNIEAGNIFWKTLVYMTDHAEIAAVAVGAAKPIIMTSRSDSPSTKLNSIALAMLMC